jgi:hypothetical protein
MTKRTTILAASMLIMGLTAGFAVQAQSSFPQGEMGARHERRGGSDVDGRNVMSILVGKDGRRTAEFRQIEGRRWIEADTSGRVKFQFEEVQRDRSSLYLEDRSRGINLQFDLRAGTMLFSDSSSPPRPYYDILDASAGEQRSRGDEPGGYEHGNGRNVQSVVFGNDGRRQGEFRKSGRKQWEEVDASGRLKYRFTEVRRDDGSVHLLDRSRGMKVELDLRSGKVMTGGRALYDIMDGPGREDNRPQQQATASNVRTVVFGNNGRPEGEFRKSSRRQWDEVDMSGRIKYQFDEVRRDHTSVYLEDQTRGVSLQLDLRSRQIIFTDRKSRPRVMYQVLDASH